MLNAAPLETDIAYGKNLVNQQDFRLKIHRNGETETRAHAGAVAANRRVDEVLEFGEGDYFIKGAVHTAPIDLEHGGREIHIFAPSQERIESEAVFAEHGKAAGNDDLAFGEAQRAEHQLQKRGLSCAIQSHDAEALPAT